MWLAKANFCKLILRLDTASVCAGRCTDESKVLKMIDYIVGGVLACLLLLALRSVLKKSAGGGCAGCSGCSGGRPSCQEQSEQNTAVK